LGNEYEIVRKLKQTWRGDKIKNYCKFNTHFIEIVEKLVERNVESYTIYQMTQN